MNRLPLLFVLIFFVLSTVHSQNSCDTILLKKANTHFDNKNFDSSIVLFSQLIAECPLFTSAYVNRGFSYYNMNNNEKAINDFDKTLEVARFKYKLALYIANRLFEADDYKLAYVYFQKVNRYNETESEPFFKMGRCLWLDRLRILNANKVQDFTKDTALSSHLKNEILYYYDKAIYIDSIQNNKSYVGKNQMDAFADMNTNYEYYYDRAVFKTNFLDYAGALADYEKSIQIHPVIDAYFYAAYLARKVNQNEKACNYIQMWATTFNPSEKIDIFKKHETADKFCKELGITKE